MRALALLLFILNSLAWLMEWEIIVGYSALKHEKIFWISWVVFIVFGFAQFLIDWKKADTPCDSEKEKDRLSTIMGIGASVLLSLSILASLPLISGMAIPVLKSRFHWAALVSFLWIVFGVFWVTWGGTDNKNNYSKYMKLARKVKTAALIHALAWAGTAAMMLINSIQI